MKLEAGSLFRKFGDKAQWAIPLYALAYAQAKGKNRECKRFLVTVLVQQIAIDSIKYLTQRARPDTKKLNSFPSGHSTAAFFGAGFYWAVSEKDPESSTMYVRATLLVLAALTGLSRYTSNRHWPTDIVAGAIMGFGFGYFAGRNTSSSNNE